MRLLVVLLALLLPATALADTPAPRMLIEQAIAAHGGEVWLEPGTLTMSGTAVFYAADSTEPRSRADDYRMWREMGADRQRAHGADGKVRIRARDGERTIFEVGYDGETTWTERGVLPKAEADAYWASAFGFGILREALKPEFTLQAVPSRNIEGHEIDLVRIIDPAGQKTMFGFDAESHFIRYMGFTSPRGWHERHYDDFVKLPETGWVQAREVTLFYDGVKNNTVYWTEVKVGEPLDPVIFAVPEEMRK